MILHDLLPQALPCKPKYSYLSLSHLTSREPNNSPGRDRRHLRCSGSAQVNYLHTPLCAGLIRACFTTRITQIRAERAAGLMADSSAPVSFPLSAIFDHAELRSRFVSAVNRQRRRSCLGEPRPLRTDHCHYILIYQCFTRGK